MSIENKPFTSYTLDDEKEDGETFTIRLNAEERKQLDKLKRLMDMKSDGKALKTAGLIIAPNVLHTMFGERLLKYLFKKERARLSDYEKLE